MMHTFERALQKLQRFGHPDLFPQPARQGKKIFHIDVRAAERIIDVERGALLFKLPPVVIAVARPNPALGGIFLLQHQASDAEREAAIDLFLRQGGKLGAIGAYLRAFGPDQNALFVQALPRRRFEHAKADLDDFVFLAGRRLAVPAGCFDIDDEDVA